MKIPLLKPQEIAYMQEAGKIAWDLKQILYQKAQPGIKTEELDKIAEDYIRGQGAIPAFKGYQQYPATLITCINEQVVHSIPSSYSLKKGDLLTLDLGAICHGYYSDTAFSFFIGEEDHHNILGTGKKALREALKKCRPGGFIGDISHAIQETIEGAGYDVVRAFVGHGVGKNLHQDPDIPCFGTPHTGERIKVGMGFAIEVMYATGKAALYMLDDGWTTVTQDGSLAAQFEETVIVTEDGLIITTNPEYKI